MVITIQIGITARKNPYITGGNISGKKVMNLNFGFLFRFKHQWKMNRKITNIKAIEPIIKYRTR